mgnify:CR=1 FL=1|jgi:hypothetical protein
MANRLDGEWGPSTAVPANHSGHAFSRLLPIARRCPSDNRPRESAGLGAWHCQQQHRHNRYLTQKPKPRFLEIN